MTRSAEKRIEEDNACKAEYACDKCRSRKIACSRELSGCQHCADITIECVYSRHGIIRRPNRKRKHTAEQGIDDTGRARSITHKSPSTELLSHLAADIDTARDQLRPGQQDNDTLSALNSLANASGSIWLEHADAAELDGSMAKKYFLFTGRAEEFADVFVASLEKGRPIMIPAAAHTVAQLRADHPEQVPERAWLVMYYSIVLSFISSVSPDDTDTKKRLLRNLWLAFNDARLLLEPSEANIQALLILAIHVEDFTSPTLCWMLTSTACRMLQALGITQRRLDAQTRERRRMLFWNLNLMDKGLAMIFGRPPTNHRAMANEIPMPTLEQLLPFRPHVSSRAKLALFGAHFLNQMMLLSRVMGDVWACLYEDNAATCPTTDAMLRQLNDWYQQATQVLDAAAMTEKPFLDKDGEASIEIGLLMPHF
ncbi:hypothetical protein AMS68_006618 [Peltaster fructicola]|uniref:Zn(2)-C6 fungal-type domain-containing protein n=1 Tax=Peltaster fructicola TaxID=286661 RepID=A0A6H0Y2G1_9PEZI|nr:hypothetical protein AMS68_006618 [Peltaster fructicola]